MTAGNAGAKRFDGFAEFAFWLAVFTMVCPFEADILVGILAHQRQTGLGSVIAIGFFSAVFIPYFVSCRRHWRQPGVWRGRGYLIATSVILAVNVLMYASVIIGQLIR